MKVWIVWASNGELYEDNNQDIWAVCDSEESAGRCIANAKEQILRDRKRREELLDIRMTRGLTESEVIEENQIILRQCCIPWCDENNGLPYFSIREYEVMN